MVVPVDRSGVPRDQPEAAKANAAIAEWQYDPKNVLSLEYACPAGGGCSSTALTVSAKIADMQVRGLGHVLGPRFHGPHIPGSTPRNPSSAAGRSPACQPGRAHACRL